MLRSPFAKLASLYIGFFSISFTATALVTGNPIAGLKVALLVNVIKTAYVKGHGRLFAGV